MCTVDAQHARRCDVTDWTLSSSAHKLHCTGLAEEVMTTRNQRCHHVPTLTTKAPYGNLLVLHLGGVAAYPIGAGARQGVNWAGRGVLRTMAIHIHQHIGDASHVKHSLLPVHSGLRRHRHGSSDGYGEAVAFGWRPYRHAAVAAGKYCTCQWRPSRHSGPGGLHWYVAEAVAAALEEGLGPRGRIVEGFATSRERVCRRGHSRQARKLESLASVKRRAGKQVETTIAVCGRKRIIVTDTSASTHRYVALYLLLSLLHVIPTSRHFEARLLVPGWGDDVGVGVLLDRKSVV